MKLVNLLEKLAESTGKLEKNSILSQQAGKIRNFFEKNDEKGFNFMLSKSHREKSLDVADMLFSVANKPL